MELGLCKKLKALPCNFGALTQLRSLDLTDTQVTELPESVTSNLCKLEIVILFRGSKFPKNIRNWVELRKLTYYDRKTDGLIMPRGIEKLTRLEVLYPFIVRKEDDVSIDTCSHNSSSSSIQELADLNSLQWLRILHLENVRGGKIEAANAKLIDKQNIQDLDLRWKSEEEEGDELAATATMVLEGLQPHPNLEKLSIYYFPGLKPPKWMSSSSCIPNLVTLKIFSSHNCGSPVGLGQLPCLKILHMFGMKSVKCLGKDFYHQQEEEGNEGFTTTLFLSLTSLYLYDMENLEEWVAPSRPDSSFPCLEHLEIKWCSNLTSIPDLRLWASSLKRLEIEGCKVKESIPYDLKKSLTFLARLYFDGF
ncbi:putative disease resistance protein At3g14460 [Papaver somniferum]|uniref:putative disease resistance protein At3g14460 n=1 Tax=Papaver somniferum TaxID=3469 RepID=UPI000E6FE04D|nr:putative disease resistance protein At3g14460 [Papaver somniferum]